MEKEKVEDSHGCDDKGEKKVEGEKSGKSGIVYRKSASDSFYQYSAHVGYG